MPTVNYKIRDRKINGRIVETFDVYGTIDCYDHAVNSTSLANAIAGFENIRTAKGTMKERVDIKWEMEAPTMIGKWEKSLPRPEIGYQRVRIDHL